MTPDDIAALCACVLSLGVLMEVAEIVRGRRALATFFDHQHGEARLSAPRSSTTLDDRLGSISILSSTFLALLFAHAALALSATAALAYGLVVAAPLALAVALVQWVIEKRLVSSGTSASGLQAILWVSLSLFAVAGDGVGQTAALAFIALQGLLGYFCAGVSKLTHPSWKRGTAIREVLQSDMFGVPRLAALLPLSLLTAPVSWSALAFEILGPPLSLLSPNAALGFCLVALCFHLGVALMMGISQFLFAFGATHPAIYFCATWLHDVLA